MTNERLRALMAENGVTVETLMHTVGVDRKTVERWIATGRTPHRTHRLRAAALLGRDETWIWPAAVSRRVVHAASESELVALYPSRGAVPSEVWHECVASAREHIDLLAFAGSFLHDVVPDFAALVRERARAGVQVRLLFGDPDSEAVALRGAEEGIGDLLSARVRLTWSYCDPLVATPGVEAREHGATLYASLFRFDSTVFVNPHAFGAAASQSPVMQLHRVPAGRLVDHYLSSFDRTWASARVRRPHDDLSVVT